MIEYERVVRTEAAARKYVGRFLWSGGKAFCPKCREDKVYRLGDERLRCSSCRYTFHDLSRRWINFGGLSCRDWLRLVKLFELELTANRMAPQVGLAYNTVYKAVTAMRFALAAKALDASQILGGEMGRELGLSGGRLSMERSKDRLTRIPVFGIMEKNGWVFVDYLPDMEAETIFHFNVSFKLGVVRVGNILYTDRYRGYDALILCGDESLPYEYIQPRDRGAYVDSLRGSFWDFAGARLKRYNGISARRFPLYLKELEFRYNHRREDVFPLIVESLCDFVPDFE